jgi:hypothetical protein
MKILRREEVWIHTHFVTDCEYLPDHLAREITRKMDRVVEEAGLVFGIHFESGRADARLHIVLECIPLPQTMQKVESALAAIIEPMPSRPRQTKVTIEPPRRRVPSQKG